MLQVSLLGEQSVIGTAGSVRARSSRAVALVAFLAVHAGAPQTRQRIASLFWPDSSDEQALTNLRRELHHVRTVLGEDPSLVVTARDLCWTDAPSCRVDVRDFACDRAAALAAAAAGEEEASLARAVAAVERYRGEFLPGIVRSPDGHSSECIRSVGRRRSRYPSCGARPCCPDHLTLDFLG